MTLVILTLLSFTALAQPVESRSQQHCVENMDLVTSELVRQRDLFSATPSLPALTGFLRHLQPEVD